MDYDEWVIAKTLLTSQLGFSMDYQLTHEEAETFGISQAIQSYLEEWGAFTRDAPDSFNKLLFQRGESNWKVQVVDFTEDVPENLLTLTEIIQNPNYQTWVLWAFYPNRFFRDFSTKNRDELLNDIRTMISKSPMKRLEWPLYYVVTTESPQTIIWPIPDSLIHTLNEDDEIEGVLQFPLAFGWDHWDELHKDDEHKLLLSPSRGGATSSKSYDVAGQPQTVGLDDLEGMGLNLEQLQIQKLSALFQFLSGWCAFDVLDADNLSNAMKDIDAGESRAYTDVAKGLAANGRSSLILRNLIQQYTTPLLEIRASTQQIVYSSVTPIFAVTLSIRENPTFATLNWKIDNLIWLLTSKT